MEKDRFIKGLITGIRGEASSKRMLAYMAFFVATTGFFLRVNNFEIFLGFSASMIVGTIFEQKKQQ